MRCSTEESRCYRCTLDVQRRSGDAIVVHEMFNGGVEILSLYIRCLTVESGCYRCTLDVQRMSRDAIVVHEMFNGGVEMLSLYIRCSTDESRCYRNSLDVQRMSRDAIVVHEMFNGWVEMLSLLILLKSANAFTINLIHIGMLEKYQACMTKSHGEDVESHPHNQETWNEVTPVKRGNTHGAGKSSDPIFVLTGIPFAPLCELVEVLRKSFEELKEARARDKELFEETKKENRNQYEEKLMSQALTMKEEMVKEANAKIAEMFAQYTQQLPIPPS
ncbi:hypothetical protein Tco_0683430 [Tanacetum coccineum]|uniref:Uncharacterized protein n=1 Tax=Tanacetum coccineum TaxID=301880 RepID=A0ABQ4XTY0_9ASTR